ncbi:MAG: hypothetical protein JOZ14_13390 [Acidobacteria bacterium]|nr:hypothetical protein [Acidobacteriota bacterium]
MGFLAIELCLAASCLAVAQIRPQLADSWFTRVEQRFSIFATKRGRAVVIVAMLALGTRIALLPQLPIPYPKVTDEFSYLLLSDTLAHGRLANPTHPMWIHFETFQVNWRPTYASMYYPGYGLFLALGQVVMGHPFWGVWLSSGLMCGAICWALQGWMPPAWAFLGALLAFIRLATFSYWVDSYWGGTVAALAGAVILGALPRIRRHHRTRNSVLLALGLTLLAGTRPYEGLFFSVPVLVALVFWAARNEPGKNISIRHVLLPVSLIMALALIALGYYFWRVTGNPFNTPYQVNMRTYGLLYFPWEKVRTIPEFHHDFIRSFYRGPSVEGWYSFARQHPLKLQFLKALVVWLFYFGPLLTLPWVAWLFTRSKATLRASFSPALSFLLVLCFVTYASCMVTIYIGQPHYVAHLSAAFYIIMLLMMRDLYRASPPPGRFLARAVPLVSVALLVARIVAPALHLTPKASWTRTWCSQDEQNFERARVFDQLEHTPGQHLVIVRYRPNHDFILDEWVYNNADIDGSKVIWARDMGPQNSELLQYFHARRAWLVEPDYNPAKLSPYAE